MLMKVVEVRSLRTQPRQQRRVPCLYNALRPYDRCQLHSFDLHIKYSALKLFVHSVNDES